VDDGVDALDNEEETEQVKGWGTYLNCDDDGYEEEEIYFGYSEYPDCDIRTPLLEEINELLILLEEIDELLIWAGQVGDGIDALGNENGTGQAKRGEKNVDLFNFMCPKHLFIIVFKLSPSFILFLNFA
jgi:hypothetical protein